MKATTVARSLGLLVVVLALASCGGAQLNTSPPGQLPNPLPGLVSLSPSSAMAGGPPSGPGFPVTATGTGFVPASVLRWNGFDRVTTFLSSTQIQATILPGDIAVGGIAQITIFSPSPGGGVSNAFPFTINNPLPTITGLSQLTAISGSPGLTLTATGTQFLAGVVLRWNGSDRPTTWVTSAQLTAAISADDLAAPGTADVTAFNPGPGGGISNTVIFTINPPAAAGLTELLSVASDGTAATVGDSFAPAVTTTSRFVAFASLAANLVSADTNGVMDVFLRDTCTGAPAGCVPTTLLVSVDSNGTQSGQSSSEPVLSGDGRFVAFGSVATNLVPGDTNLFRDIFLRDTCLGAPVDCVPTTTRLSVASDGSQADNFSLLPAMSSNGRAIAFVSKAANLVANDTQGFEDIFVRDACFGAPAGCVPGTTRVSVADDGSEANGRSLAAALSADGRFVVFLSEASNLVLGDSNGGADVFLRDTCLGAKAGCVPATTRLSVASDGAQGNDRSASRPVLSAEGRFVAFSSLATNLVANDTNNLPDVFVRDTCLGAAAGCVPATTRVSVASDATEASGGMPGAGSSYPAISADGRFVVFQSDATNLVPADTNGVQDIFIHDRLTGQTMRTSVANDATPANSMNQRPTLSGDGRFLLFDSFASNLVAPDTNNALDVFRRGPLF